MHSTSPSLSVVIANYNYAQYLPYAIDSALAQSPAFEEIVVVNDGSKDESLKVLDAYRDRVTILDIENQGQLGACLVGLDEITSEYVYFLDADDYIDADFTKHVQKALTTSPVKVQFQLQAVDEKGELTGSLFPKFPAGYSSRDMQDDNRSMGFYQCPPTSGNVFRCDTFRSLKLTRHCKPSYLDSTAPLVMPYLGEIATIDQPLGFYRVHGANCYGWDNPSIQTLSREVEHFGDTWAEAVRILNLNEPPFGSDKPLYLRERDLMLAALANDWWLGGKALRFVKKLFATNLPTRNKLMLGAWALSLVLPFERYRQSVIINRRAGSSRSPVLRAIVRAIMHPSTLFRRQDTTASRC